MAHFACIDMNQIVRQVVVVDDSILLDPETGEAVEALGTAYLDSLGIANGVWLQTSATASFRGKFAGPGMVYVPNQDAFADPKPFPSWVLNSNTYEWEPPVARPESPYPLGWDEATTSWKINLPTPDELDDEELKKLSASIYASFTS